jgi:hypothetical protein
VIAAALYAVELAALLLLVELVALWLLAVELATDEELWLAVDELWLAAEVLEDVL